VKRKSLVRSFLVVVTLFLVTSGAFFIGNKYAVDRLSITRVAPNQLANAMEGDYFYSKYRERTLLVSGAVSRIERSSSIEKLIFDSNTNPLVSN
jgi:hypothetical protein